MKRTVSLVTWLAVAAALTACGGGATSNAKASKKADEKAWQSAQVSHAVSGWKPGDKDSWEAQMRTRAQQQNDYAKAK